MNIILQDPIIYTLKNVWLMDYNDYNEKSDAYAIRAILVLYSNISKYLYN